MRLLVFYSFVFLFISTFFTSTTGGSKEDSMEECDEYFQNVEHALLGMMEKDKMPECFREVMIVFESEEKNTSEEDVLKVWVKLWNQKEGHIEIKDKKKFETCMEEVWKEVFAEIQEPNEKCMKEMRIEIIDD